MTDTSVMVNPSSDLTLAIAKAMVLRGTCVGIDWVNIYTDACRGRFGGIFDRPMRWGISTRETSRD